jgi:hypothetical protein
MKSRRHGPHGGVSPLSGQKNTGPGEWNQPPTNSGTSRVLASISGLASASRYTGRPLIDVGIPSTTCPIVNDGEGEIGGDGVALACADGASVAIGVGTSAVGVGPMEPQEASADAAKMAPINRCFIARRYVTLGAARTSISPVG